MTIWLEPLLKIVFLFAGLSVAAAYLAVLERAWSGQLSKRWSPPWKTPRTVWDVFCCGLSLLVQTPPAGSLWRGDRRSLVPAVVLAASFAAFATIPFGDSLPLGGNGRAVDLVLVPELPVGPLTFLAMNAVITVSLITVQHVGWQGLAFQPVWLLAWAGSLTLNGSLNLGTAIDYQAASGIWWLGLHPLGLILVLAASLGDPLQDALPTARPGRIDGRLAAARYFYLLAVAFLITCVFLGGWHVWWLIPGDGESITVWGGLLRCFVLATKAAAAAVGLMGLRRIRPVLHGWGLRPTVGQLLAMGAFNLVAVASIRQFTDGTDWGLQAIVSWSVLLGGVGAITFKFRRTTAALSQ